MEVNLNKTIVHLLVPSVLILSFFFFAFASQGRTTMSYQNMPSLPRPIAEENILITSAGQSSDTYIVKDIANKLMIHNFFMPQATALDLAEINTVVFVAGYSAISEKLHELDYETEYNRIEKLLALCKMDKKIVITVFIGGKQRRDHETDAILSLLGPQSDYIISTNEGDYDGLLYNIAKANALPITLVKSISDVSEPFASAFR